MTALWIIIFCIAFVIAAGTFRRRPGVALTDAAVLVFALGLIAILDLILSRFFNTGDLGWTVAAILASGFAMDSLYGLMAPQRQQRRDQWLRGLMEGKRA